MKERFSFFFQINMISIKKKFYQNSFTIKVLGGTNIKRFISRLIDHFEMPYTSHIREQREPY